MLLQIQLIEGVVPLSPLMHLSRAVYHFALIAACFVCVLSAHGNSSYVLGDFA